MFFLLSVKNHEFLAMQNPDPRERHAAVFTFFRFWFWFWLLDSSWLEFFCWAKVTEKT